MSVFPVLSVKDYDASLKFYTEKLGFTNDFTAAPDGIHKFGIFRMGQTTSLMLGMDSEPLKRPGEGVVLMFYPEDFDIDAYYEQVKSRGVAITDEIKTEYWGDRVFSIKDPDGYQLSFAKTIEQVSIDQAMERLKAQQSA